MKQLFVQAYLHPLDSNEPFCTSIGRKTLFNTHTQYRTLIEQPTTKGFDYQLVDLAQQQNMNERLFIACHPAVLITRSNFNHFKMF